MPDSKLDGDSVSAAIAAIKRATDSLSRPPGQGGSDAEQFHQHLQVRGELAEVDETTDLSQLPPHITHVRYPDGRIQRIGFS
jgi:trans-2-enoyl-CoA reductase